MDTEALGDDNAAEENQRDDGQGQRGAYACRALRYAGRVRFRHSRVHSDGRLHGYAITGGVSNVWWGTGDGSVHSNPVAPSQTLAEAF